MCTSRAAPVIGISLYCHAAWVQTVYQCGCTLYLLYLHGNTVRLSSVLYCHVAWVQTLYQCGCNLYWHRSTVFEPVIGMILPGSMDVNYVPVWMQSLLA